MAKCKLLEKCPFFNDQMQGAEDMIERTKQNYCLDNFASCARYQVFDALGRDHVPADLYPFQVTRVRQILSVVEAK
ncbi:hypothetical protein JW859_04385 [bacterium]|nr:hypothetical protein [bacterium]